jgi:hypothetical protein
MLLNNNDIHVYSKPLAGSVSAGSSACNFFPTKYWHIVKFALELQLPEPEIN